MNSDCGRTCRHFAKGGLQGGHEHWDSNLQHFGWQFEHPSHYPVNKYKKQADSRLQLKALLLVSLALYDPGSTLCSCLLFSQRPLEGTALLALQSCSFFQMDNGHGCGGDAGDEGGGVDDDGVFVSGLAPGGNLSGLDLGQGGGPGMKDPGGGQQSRFKWMMEGHSPSSSSPDAIAAMHKNGTPANHRPSVSPSEGLW